MTTIHKGKKEVNKLAHRVGCLCCPASEDILSMNTVLYQGFGGYHVEKDDREFYSGDPQGEWDMLNGSFDFEIREDPLFWQALGKALGWGSEWQGNPILSNSTVRPVWFLKWHLFIDHLARGKDAESFFDNLTNQTQ